ncbi:MAG: DegV family protein [Lachnospiraceae bacterium]|nr:DegV family protein [Lachnospiraceae bacterium]
MSYKIVVDSCCEIPEVYKKDARFGIVSLGLEVGDYHIMDDESFDQKEFLAKVAACPECPKSSCPSPESFREAYHCDADNVYVVTLSSRLSGSYNSAMLGRELYYEKYGKKNIHICDSKSASCGETQIALKAMELEEAGFRFEEVVKRLERFRDMVKTYFVLDNLETLRKNGRLTGVKALVATTLNIKPIMMGDGGTIVQKGQAMGIKKALAKLAEAVAEEAENPEERSLLITHCNCPDRAESVREMILDKIKVRNVLIMDTAGISSMYANDGGVIVTL